MDHNTFRDEWWCYCGLAFSTAEAMGEHQRSDHKNPGQASGDSPHNHSKEQS